MSIDPPIPEILHFQILTLKIQSQSHSSRSYSRYNTLSTHIPIVPCWSAFPYMGYSYFKIWHWKFKVEVMGEVIVGSHNMGPTFSRLTSLSFHVNWASHSWVMTFSKFDLENQGVKVMGEVTVQSHNVSLTSYRLTSLSFHVNQQSHSWDTAFSKFDLENRGSMSNDHDVAQLRV